VTRTAIPPEDAERLLAESIERLRATGLAVHTGVFRKHLRVEIHNEGPVTLLFDSRWSL